MLRTFVIIDSRQLKISGIITAFCVLGSNAVIMCYAGMLMISEAIKGATPEVTASVAYHGLRGAVDAMHGGLCKDATVSGVFTDVGCLLLYS